AQANCDGTGICEDDLNILLRAEELGATKPKKAAKNKSSTIAVCLSIGNHKRRSKHSKRQSAER
ncbi:MAG: hypothetical protein AAFX96_10665, partial [Pseudomonadota bacterium]